MDGLWQPLNFFKAGAGGLCQGETRVKTGAGAPPVAALGIIGQVASHLSEEKQGLEPLRR